MSSNARPFVLAETDWNTVRNESFDIAVLPWGATEAHNYHLPYGTDNYQAEYVAHQAAELAWKSGCRPIVLPCIPFGVNTGQLDIDLCINMNPSTQMSVLEDIAQVIELAGIEKLVILNGHGGNHFKQMLRELTVSFPDMFACAVNWYQSANASSFFEDPGDHGGELETSCMMHIAAPLCRPLSEAGSGAAKNFRLKAFQEGWATAQREWTEVTEDTGVGDPSKSTAEKGKAFLDACIANIAEFFQELAAAKRDDLYE